VNLFHPRKSFIWLALAATSLATLPSASARIGTAYQSPLGNPDGAVSNAANRAKYLIQRPQFHLSYNDDTHQANWVSWSITANGLGTVGRTDAWAEEELPSGYLRIGTSTFGSSFGISWDRGHMAPSGDRTQSLDDNRATFRMSNIIPQADANNQGLWAQFEDYCRSLASNNREVLIISGPSQFTGNRIPNSMSVPGSVWKIAVVLNDATSTLPIAQRVTTATRVIALLTPNVSSGLGTWQSYITSVEEIEEVTGLNFFTAIDPSTAIYLKNLVDTGNGPNNPTVITTFNPTLGNAGTQVTISGYNFNGNSTVRFNGVNATGVTYDPAKPNELKASVPNGATTGPITVTGPGGTDISYEDFTVTGSESTPVILVSPAGISSLTAVEGAPGNAEIYALNGGNLTHPVFVTAPTNFEISTDGVSFAPSLELRQAIDGSLSAQIYVRIKPDAALGDVSGTILHTSVGAADRNLSLAGKVNPKILLSTTSLSGFAAFVGNNSSSKSYTVSAGNLSGSLSISASLGFEVSLNNITFAPSLTLVPQAGSIATTVIHVRMAASAPLGAATGSITHSAPGASSKTLSVAGTVTTADGSVQKLAGWEVTSLSNYGPSPFMPTFSNELVTVGGLTRGSGVTTTGTAAGSAWGGNGFDGATNVSTAIALTNFVTFSVSSSLPLSFSNIPSHTIRRSGTGPSTGQWQYRIGSGAFANLGSPISWPNTNNNTQNAINLSTNADLQNVTPDTTVTFRLVPYNASSNVGTFYFNNISGDDLAIFGSFGTVGQLVPVITVTGTETATALQSYSYQISANNNPTSYAASGLPAGLSLDPSTGLISGTPTTPGSYLVSLTASNASGDGTATLTINVLANPNAPAITSTLIASGYINTPFSYQITATNSPTSFTAANLPAGLGINTATGLIEGTPTSGGTTSATVTAVNEFGSDSKTLQIVIRVPTLTASPSTLQSFETIAGSPSPPQNYTLTGADLAGPVTVRAPQNFELSTDGATFSEEMVFTPEPDGSLSRGIIVRLRASASAGLTSGAIAHTSSAAVPIYLNVTGTVSTPSPSLLVSRESLAPFTTTPGTASETASYEVSGASLNGDVIVTAPPRFEIATIDSAFADTIILEPVAGSLATTAIRVRVRADAPVGSYFGSISHSSAGAAPKNVTVSATVATPTPPNIITTSGGSAYRGTNTFSFTIQTDGAQTISSYGATGLPPGMNVNTNTGLVSGTPTEAGTYNVAVTATGPQGTATKSYALRVIDSDEQPNSPTIVVNKYHDSSIDRVELLVIGDNIDGPPVDLRGMIIKDFNAGMASDTGGKYVFNNHPLWANVRAGTLIVLAAGNTATEDFVAGSEDFLLQVNLANPTYFTQESGGINIVPTDMVMIKPAGMQPDGVAGGMHALAAGSSGSQFSAFTGRKLRSSNPLSGFRGYFCMASSPNRRLDDFWASNGAQISRDEIFGTGNNSNNTTYIDQLRALDQKGPEISVLGSNPVSIDRGTVYQDAGATAFDQGDNQSNTVTTASNVNVAVVGIYTVTYTSTDSKGNIGTATRTVNVVTPASIPPTVTSLPADSVSVSSATLNGVVVSEGSPAVTARGFVYGISATTVEIGAEGTTALYTGAGAGPFNASATFLSPGTTYHFRTFATNESGTVYGETMSFTTLKAEPPSHVATFAAGTITASNIAATWNAAEADGYLLIVGSAVLMQPVDGTPVTDDTDVSDGSGAINLPGSTASFSGFSGFAPGVNYTFQIFPYNNSGAAIDYKTGEAPSFSAGVVTTPEISLAGSPSALTTTYGAPSSPTSFTVSGSYLTSTVEVTAPAGFEVSADGETFAPSIALSPESGSLNAATIFLRLAATATVGDFYDMQTITTTSSGAQTATIVTAATGNGVAPKDLTIKGLSAADKIYDGNTDVVILGAPAYDGLVNNDSFPVSGNVTWAFADKNAGVSKVLVRNGNFEAPNANYSITAQPSLAASITTKELTVSGASVTTKPYDGTTGASITGATLVGVVSGDTVTISGGGTFGDANAGENKPVTANLTLSGTDAINYTLTQPNLTGTITKADQSITFGALPAKPANDPAFELTAFASSGLPITYASSDNKVATLDGSVVTLVAAGTTIITASQPGNANYNAVAVERTLVVNPASYVVAAWDFQTTSNGGTAAADSPNAPKVYTANFGSGTIYFDGSNGSSSWFVPASGTSGAELRSFGGTATNAVGLMAINTTGTASLALLGGSLNAANGKRAIFRFSMTNRANLAVTYAAQRSSEGFNSQAWEYSTDGINWLPVTTISAGNTPGTINATFANTGIISLPQLSGLDNASNAYLRVTFSGATAATGNNRLDNIRLVATDYVAPDTTPPVITVAGDNPLYLPVGATFIEPGVSAFDAINGNVAVNTTGAVNTATRGTYVLTYNATDAAGNAAASATREVIVRSGAAQVLATQFGLSGAQAILTADADNDGVANLMEYALGKNPSSATDTPAATPLELTAEGMRFSAIIREGDSAMSIAPLASTNLQSWSSVGLTELESVDQTDVPNGFRRRAWQAPGTSTTLFIRFRISYQ
jgi:DNA/RNA endonuclease G (NUC1)